MKEDKFKKLVMGGTVAAVFLLCILIIFLVYQLIVLSARRSRINELKAEIAYYEQLIADKNTDIEEVYTAKWWLDKKAHELDMILNK